MLRSALFWGMTRRREVVLYLYQHFGTIIGPIFKDQEVQLTLEYGTDTFPETSVKGYHSTLRNISEEHRFHQHLGRSLKSELVTL
jgi:hypothetical protein